MKTRNHNGTLLFLTLILVLLGCWQANAQIEFNQDEEFKLSAWVDPTFDDAGFQFGIGIRKELEWGWVGVEASVYPELTPYYADLVGQGGIILNIGRNFDFLTGPRLGLVARGDGYFPHALIGFMGQFDWRFARGATVGVRLWLDYRTDQDDQFLGDSDAHEYLIFSNPMTQENGALVLTFDLN